MLAELEPGTTLLGGLDLARPEVTLIVVPPGARVTSGQPSRVCGHLETTEDDPGHTVLHLVPESPSPAPRGS